MLHGSLSTSTKIKDLSKLSRLRNYKVSINKQCPTILMKHEKRHSNGQSANWRKKNENGDHVGNVNKGKVIIHCLHQDFQGLMVEHKHNLSGLSVCIHSIVWKYLWLAVIYITSLIWRRSASIFFSRNRFRFLYFIDIKLHLDQRKS